MTDLNIEELRKRQRNGKKLGGLVIVAVGAILLGRQMGLYIPDWVLSWPMFLIVLGIYVGAKHQFRNAGWIILCLIGGVFLADEFVPGIDIMEFFWPVFIIAAGLYMIFGRDKKWDRDWGNDWKKNWKRERWSQMEIASEIASSKGDDYIEHTAVFGNIKKTVISKDFKGGEITCIFSGAEINLSQAEIKAPVELEITNIFGGTTLIVPANWEIKTTEMTAILGGIEDKRMQSTTLPDNKNVLLLKGTTILGGIEIKSY